MLLKVGELAKHTGLTVSTLHHYDVIGLLRPSARPPSTRWPCSCSSFMGIAPMSSALTGWLLRSVTLVQLFACSGAALVAIVLIALAASCMGAVTDAPAAGSPLS